jgi:hypothetical protein
MERALRRARAVRERIAPLDDHHRLTPDFTGQAASDHIREVLASGAPRMIARMGSGELEVTLRRRERLDPAGAAVKAFRYLTGRIGPYWWDARVAHGMRQGAGLFPVKPEMLERFADRMLADLREVDVLGSWLDGEARMRPFLPIARIVNLTDLEPYYHRDPWSSVLAGRTVMVVHPFAETIRSQYARRERLFADQRVLPAFELKTMSAVQSIAGNRTDHRDWFAALDFMCERLSEETFDVAIIGAGAYGLPLAAHVKRIGRQAVHLGGPTQILFGIRGKRWDEIPFFAALANEYWVRPSAGETPTGHKEIEGGCYW